MVKAGKFAQRGLGMQGVPNVTAYGINNISKGFWFGQLTTKTARRATAQAVRVRGPTWGFTRIDYAQVWRVEVGTGKHIGAGFGAGVGTVQCWYNTTNCTLFAGATIAATIGQAVFAMIFGGKA